MGRPCFCRRHRRTSLVAEIRINAKTGQEVFLLVEIAVEGWGEFDERGRGYAQSIGGAGTSGQGHDGGSCFAADTVAAAKSGGGGGAGSPGEDGTSSGSGVGGDGISCSITGTAVYYGGGGGGGNGFTAMYGIAGGLGGGGTGAYTYSQNNSCIPATAGEPNTGGGGGGGGAFGNTAIAAGAGGSGVVIVRYALSGDPPTVISFR